jgi:hypothetical protein
MMGQIPTLAAVTTIQYNLYYIQYHFVALGQAYPRMDIFFFSFLLFCKTLRPSFVTDAVQVDRPTLREGRDLGELFRPDSSVGPRRHGGNKTKRG